MKWADKVVDEILKCNKDRQKIKDIIEDIYQDGYEDGTRDYTGTSEGIPYEDLD